MSQSTSESCHNENSNREQRTNFKQTKDQYEHRQFSQCCGTRFFILISISNQFFHKEIPSSVILLAQLFGTMPVSGILSTDTRNVKFKWKSVRVVVSIIFALFSMVETITIVKMATDEQITLGVAGALIFYSVCLFGNLFFIRIALHWPSIIRLWRRNENVFLKLPYKRWKLSLSLELRVVTMTVMAVSLRKNFMYIQKCVAILLRALYTQQLNIYCTSHRWFIITRSK